MGAQYYVHLNGEVLRESGTSASTPVIAALVTLINDARAAAGMGPMGLLNPWLYRVADEDPAAFNDVVVGDNACAAGRVGPTLTCCDEAFTAAVGWDATTGLGTPYYPALLKSALRYGRTSETAFPVQEGLRPAGPRGAATDAAEAGLTNRGTVTNLAVGQGGAHYWTGHL